MQLFADCMAISRTVVSELLAGPHRHVAKQQVVVCGMGRHLSTPIEEQECLAVGERHGLAVSRVATERAELVVPPRPLGSLVVELEAQGCQLLSPASARQVSVCSHENGKISGPKDSGASVCCHRGRQPHEQS